MNIKFYPITQQPNNYEIISQSTTIKDFKHNHKVGKPIYLSKKVLLITYSLYGKNKDATLRIWQKNCKDVRKTYKFLAKIIKWLKRNDPKFDGTFYVNVNDKLNNNEFMLEKMLDLKFTRPHFFRLTQSLSIACDFLNKENTLNNMCDFKNNICINYRTNGQNRTVGCCSKKCRFCTSAPCQQKNISCKLFMCELLVKKGYYFNTFSIPVLRQNLSLVDRIATHAVLFRSTKECFRFAWFARIATCLVMLSVIFKPLFELIKFLISLL